MEKHSKVKPMVTTTTFSGHIPEQWYDYSLVPRVPTEADVPDYVAQGSLNHCEFQLYLEVDTASMPVAGQRLRDFLCLNVDNDGAQWIVEKVFSYFQEIDKDTNKFVNVKHGGNYADAKVLSIDIVGGVLPDDYGGAQGMTVTNLMEAVEYERQAALYRNQDVAQFSDLAQTVDTVKASFTKRLMHRCNITDRVKLFVYIRKPSADYRRADRGKYPQLLFQLVVPVATTQDVSPQRLISTWLAFQAETIQRFPYRPVCVTFARCIAAISGGSMPSTLCAKPLQQNDSEDDDMTQGTNG